MCCSPLYSSSHNNFFYFFAFFLYSFILFHSFFLWTQTFFVSKLCTKKSHTYTLIIIKKKRNIYKTLSKVCVRPQTYTYSSSQHCISKKDGVFFFALKKRRPPKSRLHYLLAMKWVLTVHDDGNNNNNKILKIKRESESAAHMWKYVYTNTFKYNIFSVFP